MKLPIIDINIILVGNTSNNLVKIIKKIKSKFFVIKNIDFKKNNPNCSNGFYLNQSYTDEQLNNLTVSTPNMLNVIIVNAELEDGFYIRGLSKDKVAISTKVIEDILIFNDIPLGLFLKRSLIELVVLYIEFGYELDDNMYKIVHSETRGCLFDLNADLRDIKYNIESPIICEECSARLAGNQKTSKHLNTIQNELKNIKSPFLLRIERKIKAYPILSILITILSTIFLNIISHFVINFISK